MEARVRRALAIMVCAALALLAARPSAVVAQDDAHALTAAYNESGQDLFRRLSAGGGNLVISPYSIGTAMAMALAGARGDTARQMAKALHQGLPPDQIDAANAEVLAALREYDHSAVAPSCPNGMQIDSNRCRSQPDDNGRCPPAAAHAGADCVAEPHIERSAKLAVANALMLARGGAPISKDYISRVARTYAADVFQDAGLDDVNGWVSRKTEGRIDRILDELGPDTAAVILNAIYFKARWAAVFSKAATRDDSFNLAPRHKVSVPMMHRNGNYALVARRGYRAMRLPYEVPSLGMIIVLPDEIDGLARVSARLKSGELAGLTAALKQPRAGKLVELSLPRFKLISKADLVVPYRDLGMRLAFEPGKADFSGMTGRSPSERPTAIGQIVHRAFIDVMEDGTEAAAATAVTVRVTSAPARPAARFQVDRPFLCYIVDDATGAILFQARVADPR